MGNCCNLLIFLLGIYSVVGQTLDPPPREIFPLTGAQMRQLRLVHNPDLLEVAARTNENVFLRFRTADMTVIVQENVNVFFDCEPWARNFPGGSIRWYKRALQLDADQGLVQRSPFEPSMNSTRIDIGGFPPLDRWFNLTGTIASEGAQDPDYGDYRCEVCVDRDRFDNNFGPNCHNSTTTLFIAGAPPDVVQGRSNETQTTPIPDTDRNLNLIQVGGDFCVTEAESNDYTITCDIATTPSPVPTQIIIQWLKDGQTVASFDPDGSRDINPSFFATGSGNEVFNPININPSVLAVNPGDDLLVNSEAHNVSMMATDLPMGLSMMQIRQRIVNSLLGNWTCSASNVYGSDSESTIIRRCEGRPTFPGCAGGATAIFPRPGSVVPIGCTICIPRGSSVTIDCNAMTPSNILTYSWLRNGTNIASTRTLRVTEEDSYTCRAANLDFPNEMETSVLVYSIALDFNAQITSSAGAQVAGNGCSRLRATVNNTDLCVFIGEQVNISCINTETRAVMNYTNTNNDVFASGVRMVNDASFESNYTCRIQSPDECGRVGRRLNVRVFDPARIDRSVVDPPGSLGVGQFVAVQRPTVGDPVTLSCQTNGIDDPSTGWFFVNETSGCGIEMPITDGVTTTAEGDSTLAITEFGASNAGTYICRTDNIAGRDAASIVLSSVPETTRWEIDTEFGECSLMCRDGVRSRSVSCRSFPGGRLRPSSECTGNMPAVSETCQEIFPDECFLTPIFGFTKFSDCPRCGGSRERDVFCFVPMTGERVDKNECFKTGLPEPSSSLACPNNCCKENIHPACDRLNRLDFFCRLKEIQRLCCWTCRSFVG